MAVRSLSAGAPPGAEDRIVEEIDPRAACNLILDKAQARVPITNMALQRLLYLAHGMHLIRTKRPLVYGYFEAWRHGPVHAAAHDAFKAAAHRPITFRAINRDPFTHEITPIAAVGSKQLDELIERIVGFYGRLPTGRLVELCAAPNSPWDSIVDEARTGVVLGMIIADDIILERFKYHKMPVNFSPREGTPCEDRPYL